MSSRFPSRFCDPRSVASRARGQHIPEFAATLVVLVIFVALPVMDYGIMVVRYFSALEIVNSYAHKMALCESFSQAVSEMNKDPSLHTRLETIGGVHPTTITPRLVITTLKDPNVKIVIEHPQTIPDDWLPNGDKQPCDYSFELVVRVDIAPAVIWIVPGQNIAGLTGPVSFNLPGQAHWENLGRNPATKGFYVNE